MKTMLVARNLCVALMVLLVLTSNARAPQRQSDKKMKALEVLKTKCNVCHIKKNPRRIFNTATMEIYAEKIRQQVFVKKRMPKGKENKLTEEEYQVLAAWLAARSESELTE
jgi:uncharacterized membrane protein